jgi:S-adenosylmethionine:tRNA ribosyltransferase-isomerase
MKNINIPDYYYDLPENRIAQHPVRKRDRSKLLFYDGNNISSDLFTNLDAYIPDRSLLVFNNTRVIRARLLFRKKSGAIIEIFCLEPLAPSVYEKSFASKEPVEWKCIIGNLRKWKTGILTLEVTINRKVLLILAEKVHPEADAWRIRFSWNNPELSFGEVIEAAGHIPLPPYITREDEKDDIVRYQTVYSAVNGSVAAPTAGLHFTEELIQRLSAKGIQKADITLHVGAGTFQPVRTRNISDHEMHCEHFFVTSETIKNLVKYTGKIIAVGTTSVRTIESLYWLGVKVINNLTININDLKIGQWEPYGCVPEVTVTESLNALLDLMDRKKLSVIRALTKIMIVPGYKFMVINGMITNFHQPGSTLLLLVSAWTGRNWLKIYDYALKNDFRFLSYGDSSLLFK